MEEIDVLMATYNGEKYLKEQIDSILNQSYSNFKLIISDDCSTDKTRDILKEYENKDKRIKVYYQEKNMGYVRNFEFLLKKVENQIYMLSDQDDYWLPEKIERTYKKLKEENADLVFTDLIVVDDNKSIINSSFNRLMKLERKIQKTLGTYNLVYLYNCVTGCTIMGKKSMLSKILPIPKKSKHLIHDHWIALVTSMNGKIVYLSEKLIEYRQHTNNQIGINHVTTKYKNVEQIREHFIKVKLGIFGMYVENAQVFPEKISDFNIKAYRYFEELQSKNNINFKGWNVFYNLYKNESFKYYIENFLILNIPFIVRIILKIKGRINGFDK